MKIRFVTILIGILLMPTVSFAGFPSLDVLGSGTAVGEMMQTAMSKFENAQQVLTIQQTMAKIGSAVSTISDFINNAKEKVLNNDLLKKAQEYKGKIEEYKGKYEALRAEAQNYIDKGKGVVDKAKDIKEQGLGNALKGAAGGIMGDAANKLGIDASMAENLTNKVLEGKEKEAGEISAEEAGITDADSVDVGEEGATAEALAAAQEEFAAIQEKKAKLTELKDKACNADPKGQDCLKATVELNGLAAEEKNAKEKLENAKNAVSQQNLQNNKAEVVKLADAPTVETARKAGGFTAQKVEDGKVEPSAMAEAVTVDEVATLNANASAGTADKLDASAATKATAVAGTADKLDASAATKATAVAGTAAKLDASVATKATAAAGTAAKLDASVANKATAAAGTAAKLDASVATKAAAAAGTAAKLDASVANKATAAAGAAAKLDASVANKATAAAGTAAKLDASVATKATAAAGTAAKLDASVANKATAVAGTAAKLDASVANKATAVAGTAAKLDASVATKAAAAAGTAAKAAIKKDLLGAKFAKPELKAVRGGAKLEAVPANSVTKPELKAVTTKPVASQKTETSSAKKIKNNDARKKALNDLKTKVREDAAKKEQLIRQKFKTSYGYGKIQNTNQLSFAFLGGIGGGDKTGETPEGFLIVPESASLNCDMLDYEKATKDKKMDECLRKINTVANSMVTEKTTKKQIDDAAKDINNSYVEFLTATYFEALDIYNETLTFKNNKLSPVSTASTTDIDASWRIAKEMHIVLGDRINLLHQLWSRVLAMKVFSKYAAERFANKEE